MNRSLSVRRALLLAALGGTVLASTAHAAPTTLTTSFTLTGEREGDAAGLQTAHGDLDGDGVGDLVIGAWREDTGGEDAGAVYIEYGPVQRKDLSLATADVKLHPELKGDYVGEGPLAVLDLDGDGADDLVLGAPGSLVATQPGTGGKVGEAYVLYGGKRLSGRRTLADVADATLTGIQVQEFLGFGSGGVGDLDADGFEDLFVGAPATAGFTGAGYLFYGARDRLAGRVPVTTADAVFVGAKPGSLLGYRSAGGDLDGDGASELLVGGHPLVVPTVQSVHLWYGAKGARLSGTLLAARADASIVTPAAATRPTAFVADQDLTGDGTDDLVVGEPSPQNADQAGHVWVIPGGPRLTGTVLADRAARSTVLGTGNGVEAADVTGDGVADLITGDRVGARVHVFRGPLPAGRITLDAASAVWQGAMGSDAGVSLDAGDVTGDRRADLVLGAPVGGTGRVHVIAGRSRL